MNPGYTYVMGTWSYVKYRTKRGISALEDIEKEKRQVKRQPDERWRIT